MLSSQAPREISEAEISYTRLESELKMMYVDMLHAIVRRCLTGERLSQGMIAGSDYAEFVTQGIGEEKRLVEQFTKVAADYVRSQIADIRKLDELQKSNLL